MLKRVATSALGLQQVIPPSRTTPAHATFAAHAALASSRVAARIAHLSADDPWMLAMLRLA